MRYRKLFGALLAALVLASPAMAGAGVYEAFGCQYRTNPKAFTNKVATVLTAPNKQPKKLGELDEFDGVCVLGKKNEWLHVRYYVINNENPNDHSQFREGWALAKEFYPTYNWYERDEYKATLSDLRYLNPALYKQYETAFARCQTEETAKNGPIWRRS